MDTLPREDVLPHPTSKASPQLGRGGFGVQGGGEGAGVIKLGGAEEGAEDCTFHAIQPVIVIRVTSCTITWSTMGRPLNSRHVTLGT